MEEEEVDSLQNRFINTLGQVVKSCRLGEQIDVQQFLLSMQTFVEDLSPDEPYDLMELFEFLHEQEVAKEDIDEVFLVFKQREEHIGISIVLPVYVDAVPDNEKERILAEYHERLERSLAEPAPEAPPPPPEKKVKELAQYDNIAKKKKKKPIGLAVTTVLTVAGGIAFGYWNEKTATRAPVIHQAGELAVALPCKTVKTFKPREGAPSAICMLSEKDMQQMSESTFRKKAMVAKNQFANLGYSRMVVKLIESNKILTIQRFED